MPEAKTLWGGTGTSEQRAADYLFVSLVCLVCGRFLSVALLRWAASGPRSSRRRSITGIRLMAVYAVANTLLCLLAVVAGGSLGCTALIAVSFGMSIMFPTIFSTAIAGLGDDTEIASGIIVSMIFGGACFTPLMGEVSDLASSINAGYLVPALCFGGVAVYAFRAAAREEGTAGTAGAAMLTDGASSSAP